jgi:hypothetical protein
VLPGFTPGLPDVLGVPVQFANFEPPGVIFVVESADADADTEAEADAFAFADAFPEACSSLVADVLSDFFA